MSETKTTAIAEYEPIAAALAGIEKYRGLIFEVKTPQGLKEAKAAHREVAGPRIALEKARTKLKADVLERGRLIDGEAKRIGALFAAIEDPIKAQIDAEELRVERERQAAIEAEQRRLAEEERLRKEAEERKLAEEREKLARERAEFERQQAEAKAKIDAEERASRQRIEDAEATARAERKAEDDRLRAEREQLDVERRKLEKAARDEQFAKDEAARAARLEEQRKREAEENAAAQARRDKERAEQDLLDAQALLDSFVERFGHLKRFAPVVQAIKGMKPAKRAA